MNFTKRLLIALFILFSSQCVFSQEDISGASESVKKIAKIGTDRWRNTLILTNNQAEKLLNITTAYEMKKNEIFKSDATSAEEMNSALMSLEKEHHESVEAILSEKQIEKFRAKLTPIQG